MNKTKATIQSMNNLSSPWGQLNASITKKWSQISSFITLTKVHRFLKFRYVFVIWIPTVNFENNIRFFIQIGKSKLLD